MFSTLHDLFDQLDALVDQKNSNYFSISRFTSAFYGAPDFVENELIPELIRLSSLSSFRIDVYGLYRAGLKDELQRVKVLLEENPGNEGARLEYIFTVEELQPKIAITDFDGLVRFYEAELERYTGNIEIYDSVYKSSHGVSGVDFVQRTFPWYWIGHMLYARRRLELQRFEFFEQCASKQVAFEYARIGVDLVATDSQFSKYRMLSLEPHHRIENDKDSQTIFDERLQKYFWINVPRRLLFALEALRIGGYYSQIAFNIKAVTDMVLMLDDMERGAKLKINVAEMPDVSRFYSAENFENSVWVVHNRVKSSLTFEEHRSDFEGFGDKVVTQVVHLEYSRVDGNTLITHLDHEFILYTLEEYILRQKDSSVKGSAGKVKSFKIDGAEIPFNFKYDGDWFLLTVLDAYFMDHRLIQEIFDEMQCGS